MSEKDKNEILNDHEMSKEEMEAVSGGGPRIDWPAECRRTVQDDHLCFTGDACYGMYTQYTRDKSRFGCSSTVEFESFCKASDACAAFSVRYAKCSSDFGSDLTYE